jgi:hypothetical protein
MLPGFKVFTTPLELSSNKRGYGLIVAVKETTLFGA